MAMTISDLSKNPNESEEKQKTRMKTERRRKKNATMRFDISSSPVTITIPGTIGEERKTKSKKERKGDG
jgi:hypothetical protein